MNKEFLFTEAIRDAFLTQNVNEPTRRRGSDRPSSLDLVLISDLQPDLMAKNEQSLGKSDHSLI